MFRLENLSCYNTVFFKTLDSVTTKDLSVT